MFVGFFLKKGNSVKIDDKVIKQPNAYLWLCSIGLIFYVCIALMCILFPSANDGGRLPGIIVLVVLTAITGIPLMVLLIFSINWKITLGEDSFEYRNMFRKTRKYHYSDINIKCIVGKSYLEKEKNIKELEKVSLAEILGMAELVANGIKNVLKKSNIYV